ncbi:porin, partial [Mesorhizobium sp. NBIMC_P2-C1]|uniref:porin n=1 Tax=Mesorhizobium sp. NBIMC_P2-C1 TaxID=1320555 RepID=UPI000465ECDA
MNIKSLLLGSAAALLAVSGARAADAVVVAEPEPAEYVKICDVYGAGYFYIPGTETCLRVGGYIRYDAGFGDVGSFDGARANDRLTGKDQGTWWKRGRFALKTWTGQETELGTLKTYTETRFDFSNSSGDQAGASNYAAANGVTLNFAWIQLGGLRVGKDESAFNTFIGYAGNVINDTLVPYGDFDTNLISYTFDAGNGLSAIVSFEQGSGGESRIRRPGDTWVIDNNTIDSYVPHVVGGVKYTAGWGGIVGVVAYDSNLEEVAAKVRVDVKVSDQIDLWVMGGYGGEDLDKGINHTYYKQWDGNWAVWGGGTYKFNEKTSFNVQASYDQGKTFGLAANIAHQLVPGFTVTAEVDYLNEGNFGKPDYTGSWTNANKKNSVGGLIRFQR